MAAADIINAALSNAESMRSSATSALSIALAKLQPPMHIGASTFELNPIVSTFDLGAPPVYSGLHYEAPVKTFGAAPTMEPIPDASYGAAPVNTASNPGFVTPVVPAALHSFDKNAPYLDSIVVPSAPDALTNLNLIPPTLTEIVVPDAPTVSLPEFLAARPNTDISAPTDFAQRFSADYSGMSTNMRSALDGAMDAHLLQINPEYNNQMAALEAKLSTYMAGGTALSTEVEQAIYNRARDRVNGEYQKVREQIWDEGTARGFTIPGGAQFGSLRQARQAMSDANGRMSMEIAVKQAELEQNNIQFALTQSANLRSVVMSAMVSWFGNLIQLNGQSIEYARDVMQAAIALYDTMVKIATANIEIYRAEAQVYEIRLKAVLAVYDVYQAEIKALEAQANIDRAKVDAFSAQANAYGALANAYRAIIDGVSAKAQIEKLKADIYGVEVQAYSAEVGAKQAEWQGFTAQVQGESEKQRAYQTQVGAYREEVSAWGLKIQAYNNQLQAVIAKNEGAYKTYNASVQAYNALVTGASEAIKAEVAAFDGTVQGYVAAARAEEARATVNLSANEATTRNMLGLYEFNYKNLIHSAEMYNNYMTQSANVAISASNVYAGMASSAMAGVNALGADINSTTT